MDSTKELKALFDKQKKLFRTSLVVNQRLADVQHQINALLLKQISSITPIVSTDKDIMTENEVCDWLGKSKATMYRLRNYHNFPHTKIDGQKSIMYSRKAITYYFEQNQKCKL